MNRDEAEALAGQELARFAPEIGVPVELLMSSTVEKRLGWVFFYNSKEFIETGEFSSRLAGNGPIVVHKENGRVVVYGSVPSVDEILTSLE